MKYPLVLVLLAACGSGWADADTKSATDAVHAQMTIETLCGGDGGACVPSQVRALERMSYCSNASMLTRHGETVPALPGVQCQP